MREAAQIDIQQNLNPENSKLNDINFEQQKLNERLTSESKEIYFEQDASGKITQKSPDLVKASQSEVLYQQLKEEKGAKTAAEKKFIKDYEQRMAYEEGKTASGFKFDQDKTQSAAKQAEARRKYIKSKSEINPDRDKSVLGVEFDQLDPVVQAQYSSDPEIKRRSDKYIKGTYLLDNYKKESSAEIQQNINKLNAVDLEEQKIDRQSYLDIIEEKAKIDSAISENKNLEGFYIDDSRKGKKEAKKLKKDANALNAELIQTQKEIADIEAKQEQVKELKEQRQNFNRLSDEMPKTVFGTQPVKPKVGLFKKALGLLTRKKGRFEGYIPNFARDPYLNAYAGKEVDFSKMDFEVDPETNNVIVRPVGDEDLDLDNVKALQQRMLDQNMGTGRFRNPYSTAVSRLHIDKNTRTVSFKPTASRFAAAMKATGQYLPEGKKIDPREYKRQWFLSQISDQFRSAGASEEQLTNITNAQNTPTNEPIVKAVLRQLKSVNDQEQISKNIESQIQQESKKLGLDLPLENGTYALTPSQAEKHPSLSALVQQHKASTILQTNTLDDLRNQVDSNPTVKQALIDAKAGYLGASKKYPLPDGAPKIPRLSRNFRQNAGPTLSTVRGQQTFSQQREEELSTTFGKQPVQPKVGFFKKVIDFFRRRRAEGYIPNFAKAEWRINKDTGMLERTPIPNVELKDPAPYQSAPEKSLGQRMYESILEAYATQTPEERKLSRPPVSPEDKDRALKRRENSIQQDTVKEF